MHRENFATSITTFLTGFLCEIYMRSAVQAAGKKGLNAFMPESVKDATEGPGTNRSKTDYIEEGKYETPKDGKLSIQGLLCRKV